MIKSLIPMHRILIFWNSCPTTYAGLRLQLVPCTSWPGSITPPATASYYSWVQHELPHTVLVTKPLSASANNCRFLSCIAHDTLNSHIWIPLPLSMGVHILANWSQFLHLTLSTMIKFIKVNTPIYNISYDLCNKMRF